MDLSGRQCIHRQPRAGYEVRIEEGSMDRSLVWGDDDLSGRRPLPPSVQQIQIDDDALWDDLCDAEQWQPLQEAVRGLMRLVRSPRSMREVPAGEWNLAQF